MNLFILFSVLLLNNALPGSAVPDGTTNCVENATLSRECNTCLCNSSGNATLCKSSCDNSTVIHDSNDQTNQVCQPNDVKMENCNRCRCAANGIGWFCTRRACHPNERPQRQAPPTYCTPGTSKYDGCNTCVCTASRTYSCTERLCLRKKRSVPNGRHCTPGQQWKNDCNDCFCTETGIAACTLRGCLPFRVGHPHITIIHPNRNHTFNGNQFRRNQTTSSTNQAVDVASTAVVTNVENGLDHHQTTT